MLFFENERKMIPRWRDARTTVASGELNSLPVASQIMPPSDKLFPHKLSLWQRTPNLVNAVELITAGIVLGREKEAVSAAEFILRQNRQNAPSVLSTARTILSRAGVTDTSVSGEYLTSSQIQIDPIQVARQNIGDLRKRLTRDPRNSLAVTDMARAYAILGQYKKSKSAMQLALKMQPNNRFILRSATRLYVHLNEPKTAHDLLRRKKVILQDPWLLGAEIAAAMAAGRTSQFVKEGRFLIEYSQNAPWNITELASTIATLDLSAGANRHARKLFLRSLVEPSENSVAQAEWAARSHNVIDFRRAMTTQVNSYEARAYEQSMQKNWTGAAESCENWWLDEPFSAQPAVFASYLAICTFEDSKQAEKIARAGLRANPNDNALLNNLTVALALQDRPQEAQVELDKIKVKADDAETSIAIIATQGLIHYRKGDRERGRILYADAVLLAQRKGIPEMGVLALLHLLREEFRVGQVEVSLLEHILDDASRQKSILIQGMVHLLRENYLYPATRLDNIDTQFKSFRVILPHDIEANTKIGSEITCLQHVINVTKNIM